MIGSTCRFLALYLLSSITELTVAEIDAICAYITMDGILDRSYVHMIPAAGSESNTCFRKTCSPPEPDVPGWNCPGSFDHLSKAATPVYRA